MKTLELKLLDEAFPNFPLHLNLVYLTVEVEMMNIK